MIEENHKDWTKSIDKNNKIPGYLQDVKTIAIVLYELNKYWQEHGKSDFTEESSLESAKKTVLKHLIHARDKVAQITALLAKCEVVEELPKTPPRTESKTSPARPQMSKSTAKMK